MAVWVLRLYTMVLHAPRDRRTDSGRSLSISGVLGYLAALAALLALLTAPLVTAAGLVLAGLAVALLRGIDRPRRRESSARETTAATAVTSDTATE
jgi:hypothetical protein